MADRAIFDQNNRGSLLAVSNDGFNTPVALWADPTTHALVTSGSGGGGSGTQYAEGSTTSPATGTAMLGRYLSSPAGTLTNGQMSMPLMDNYGQLKVVPVGTVTVQDTAAETSLSTIVTNQTNGNQQTKITDGTNQSNVLIPGTSPAGQNALITTGTGYTTSTLTLNVGSPNTAWLDMLNFSWVSVEVLTNTAPSTLTWQTTGDAAQTNTSGMPMQIVSGVNAAPVMTSTSAVATYHAPRFGRYFRVSSNVSGVNTVTLAITFFTNPSAQMQGSVAQSGTWTVGSSSATGSAVPANAFYIGAKSGTSLIGLLMGSQTTANSLAVALASDQAPVNVGLSPSSTALNTYSVHLTSNTTTTPTSSTAYISSITISNEVGGTTSSITIQDKQGTPLKLVNGLATTALTTAPTVINFQTPVKMVSGIDIITAGAVAATVDVWVNYYQ